MTITAILEQNKEYIIQKYLTGISTNKLAIEFSCNSGNIYFLLKKNKIPINKKQKYIGNIKDYINKILTDFDNGKSAYSISKDIKISKSTVLNVLKKNKRTLISKVNKNNLLKNKIEKVIKLYTQDKKTINEIAKILGHSSSQIWILLNKSNINTSNCYSVDETFFDKIDTEEKAYALGIWYSDGCVDETGKLRIELQIGDEDILLKLKLAMKYSGPLLYKKGSTNRCQDIVGLIINRQKLCKQLINKGCVPRKSMIVKFPTSDILPDNLYWHFVRGFLDGDGSINRNYISFTSTDIFNKILQFKLNSFKIDSKIYYRYKDKNTCSLMISKHKNMEKLLDLIYENATIKMDRKYKKYLEFKTKMKTNQ